MIKIQLYDISYTHIIFTTVERESHCDRDLFAFPLTMSNYSIKNDIYYRITQYVHTTKKELSLLENILQCKY